MSPLDRSGPASKRGHAQDGTGSTTCLRPQKPGLMMRTSSTSLWSIAALVIVCAFLRGIAPQAQSAETKLGFSFTNVAREAGLDATTIYGGQQTNKYLLETTGCGAAALDYDGDGWMDIFLVNGTTLEGFP